MELLLSTMIDINVIIVILTIYLLFLFHSVLYIIILINPQSRHY